MVSQASLANAIRVLAMDGVQAANSGHPGAPMGMAEIAVALWNRHLKHNPAAPKWADRDRFVLSNGHGSMLIYALLNLTGYDLPLDELKKFRQLHSKTPGHPEVGHTPGVETTTGPLGQGISKGHRLAEFIAQRGIAPREVIAFGDQANDKEMLELAGLGVAMGNSRQEVRDCADWVTGSNDSDGIADVLHRFVLETAEAC